MKECWNLHNHNVEIYVWKNNNFNKAFRFNKNSLTNLINNNSIDLYGIECKYCDEIYNDYKSNVNQSNNNKISVFCTKYSKSKYNYENVKMFEFLEFGDYILIGTKNEIISYISQSYNIIFNERSEIKKQLKNKENSFNKIQNDFNQEKAEKEKFKNDLDKIKKEKNALANELKNEKLLNSKFRLEEINFNTEKQNLNKEIANLKIKNQELDDNLKKISSDNNANIKIILAEVEKEKSINKNLQLKISKYENINNQQNEEKNKLKIEIKEKENIIENLKKNNDILTNNNRQSKRELAIKENKIQNLNDSLNKEKEYNKNIALKLNSEIVKNKKLNDKLDNIASQNNENINKVLQELDKEKKINENLKSEYSELEKKEKIKSNEKQELESQLQKKDEELENIKKNYIPENYGLKFQSDCKAGEYDIVLNINSIRGLIKEGWIVNYNQKEGKQHYLKKKDEPTIVVGVIGNKNMGKTFILEKLSGYQIPKGFNVKTIGLSVRYGTTPEHNVAILDSAGQETPLLIMEPSKNMENLFPQEKKEIINESQTEIKMELKASENYEKEEELKKNEDIEDESNNDFEKYSRDKLITEFFLQKFIIWKSDILILVVGNISLTEQKLLYKVKQEVKNLNKNKQIFVIHNLKEYTTEEQVNDYIENTLKKLCKIELDETKELNILKDNTFKYQNYFNKYYKERGENVTHFIFVNEFPEEKSQYFNVPAIRHIQEEIEVIKTRNKFSVIDECKEFLMKIAEEIMEESLKKENLVTIEGENCDKIFLKNTNEINLKSYAVNEVGLTFRNDSDEPKYSCYIDPKINKLYIHIELPGGGKITKDLTVKGNYYLFSFSGEKYGDRYLEEDEKNETKNLHKINNKRKSIKFKFHIEVPCALIQVQVEEGKSLAKTGNLVHSKDGKGILTFEYNVILINQKRDKNDNEEIEF